MNIASYIKHGRMCWYVLTFKTHRPIFHLWAHTSDAILDLQAAGPAGEADTSPDHQVAYSSWLLDVKKRGRHHGSQEESPCTPYEPPRVTLPCKGE